MARDFSPLQPASAGQAARALTGTPAGLPSLFVTGGSGFIGRRFLAALAARGFDRVTCLARQAGALPLPRMDGWRAVSGDLATPSSYRDEIREGDVVVHLAAATGAATPDQLIRTNVTATGDLVRACAERGVTRMLFVSSIAAGYPDLSEYPYGRSKADAEALLRASPLDYTILRPTMVLGEGSPVWQRLRALAGLPCPVVIGDGRTLVQPIAVEDVALGMVRLLEQGRFADEVLALGGPEVLTFGELVQRIRAALGKAARPLVRIPAFPLRFTLRAAQRLLGGRVPVSPGQLVPFLADGTAPPSDFADQLRPSMMPLGPLLQQLAGG